MAFMARAEHAIRPIDAVTYGFKPLASEEWHWDHG